MTLEELLGRLEDLDGMLTIYAEGGAAATPDSRAVAEREPGDGSRPLEAHGLDYLLEVAVAQEVVAVWRAWRAGREPTAEQRCEAIAHYARDDTYLPV